MSYLIILDALKIPPPLLQIESDVDSVSLLSFNPDRQVVDQVITQFEQQGIDTHYISAAGRLDSVALYAREKFSKLVAEIPLAFKVNGKNLKEAVSFENRLSLWWLNDLSSKRSDLYPTFTRVCQLEIIQNIAHEYAISTIRLFTEDCDFWDILYNFCQQAGINLKSSRPKGKLHSFFLEILNIIRIVSSTIEWFLRTGVQTFLAKLLTDSNPQGTKESTRVCAFHTHYPGLWKGASANRDEKYAGVPITLEETTNVASIYALTFSTDGRHQSVSIGDYYRYCRWLQTKNETLNECRAHLVDADIKWRDFIRAIRYISVVWRYLHLEVNSNFKKLWVYDGVNIFPLIRRELRFAMDRTPRYLLHLLRIRRFVEKIKPKYFVTHLFEFCYGRATIYAVKTALETTKVIGVQHGPISRRKLIYYYYPGELLPYPDDTDDFIHNIPIPDRVILEGEGAKERLVEAGYPIDRLVVAGAPRLGQLLQVPLRRKMRCDKIDSSKRVLVVFGQHDGIAILSACIPAMINLKDYHFIYKLHPRSPSPTQGDIKSLLSNKGFLSTYEVATDSVYNYLCDADLVLATYSSVGVEALARGIPTLCLLLPNFVNTSPILDLVFSKKLMVGGGRDLEFALRRILDATAPIAIDQEYVEKHIFGKIDSSVELQWARAIVGDMDSRV